MQPSYSWVEGKIYEASIPKNDIPENRQFVQMGKKVEGVQFYRTPHTVKFDLYSTGRLEMADLMKVAEYGVVVRNIVQATHSSMYTTHGGHVLMRLLSDAVCTRLLTDLYKPLKVWLANFNSTAPLVLDTPVLFNVGYKYRDATTPDVLPGLHVNVRPGVSTMDACYWDKTIQDEQLQSLGAGWYCRPSSCFLKTAGRDLMAYHRQIHANLDNRYTRVKWSNTDFSKFDQCNVRGDKRRRMWDSVIEAAVRYRVEMTEGFILRSLNNRVFLTHHKAGEAKLENARVNLLNLERPQLFINSTNEYERLYVLKGRTVLPRHHVPVDHWFFKVECLCALLKAPFAWAAQKTDLFRCRLRYRLRVIKDSIVHAIRRPIENYRTQKLRWNHWWRKPRSVKIAEFWDWVLDVEEYVAPEVPAPDIYVPVGRSIQYRHYSLVAGDINFSGYIKKVRNNMLDSVPRATPSEELFFRGTLQEAVTHFPSLRSVRIFMIDCHYYFQQSDIQYIRKWQPHAEYFIGGMNFIEHPIHTTVWREEAELICSNGQDGTMDVSYTPRANKSYSHKMCNVVFESGLMLQNIPVAGNNSDTNVLNFFAYRSKTPEIRTVENFSSMQATVCDVVRKVQESEMTTASITSLSVLTKATPSQIREALNAKKSLTAAHAKYIKLLSNRGESENWTASYDFKPVTDGQMYVRMAFSILFSLIEPLVGFYAPEHIHLAKALTPDNIFSFIVSSVRGMAPSKTKSSRVTTAAKCMAYLWDRDVVGSRTLINIPQWSTLARVVMTTWSFAVAYLLREHLRFVLAFCVRTSGFVILASWIISYVALFIGMGAPESLFRIVSSAVLRIPPVLSTVFVSGAWFVDKRISITWILLTIVCSMATPLQDLTWTTSNRHLTPLLTEFRGVQHGAMSSIHIPVISIKFNVLCILFWCFLSSMLLVGVVREALKVLYLPADLFLTWLEDLPLHNAGIGSTDRYLLLSKVFNIDDSKGNHSLVRQIFNGVNLIEFLRADKNQNASEVTSKATKTGPVLTDAQGTLQVYEWNNDNSGLKTALWCRQLATGLMPDPEIVRRFKRHAEKICRDLVQDCISKIEPVDIQQEIRDSVAWSATKKKTYFANCMKTLNRTRPWNKTDEHFYKAMVKVGEKNCVSLQWVEQFLGGIRKLSDRARLIFVPHGEAATGLLTMM